MGGLSQVHLVSSFHIGKVSSGTIISTVPRTVQYRYYNPSEDRGN